MRGHLWWSFACFLAWAGCASGAAQLGTSSSSTGASTGVSSSATGGGTTASGSTSSGSTSGTSSGGTGTGTSSTSGGSSSGSTTTGAAFTHAPFPQVPDNGGQILAWPKLVGISYAGDVHSAQLAAFEQWLMTSNWVPSVGQEYGIDGGSFLLHLTLDAGKPATLTDAEIQGLIASLIVDAGTLPAPDSNTIYAFFVPAGTVASLGPGSGPDCPNYSGYHSAANGPPAFVYLVIPDCYPQGGAADLADIEGIASHELIEAATDPFFPSAYAIVDGNDPWTYLGGEIGDLCAADWVTSDAGFTTQRIWSNIAAADGGVAPCVPGTQYDVVTPIAADQPIPTVAPGGTYTFHLVGWEVGMTDHWQLRAIGFSPYGPGSSASFTPTIALSSSQAAAGGEVDLTVTVPTGAAHNAIGAVFIGNSDPSDATQSFRWVIAVIAS
jgi:hypothetical protein